MGTLADLGSKYLTLATRTPGWQVLVVLLVNQVRIDRPFIALDCRAMPIHETFFARGREVVG